MTDRDRREIVCDADVEKPLVAFEWPVLAQEFEIGKLERIVTSWCAD
jgi:hypothetical protein